MGGITEIATGAPGYSSVLPNTMSPLARTLKLNGYSTAQFGKCHEVPVWETSPVGPFDAWPTGGGGFEYFYGFIGGEANQWYPTLYEGTTPVEPEKTPEEGYHFMEDMTDKAIAWIGQQKALAPDKPFFVYFAPGATHAPHHVPKEWADKYKGKFDAGLGQAARGDLRPAEEARRHPGGLPAHRAPQGDPGLGRHAGGAQAGAAPPDGGVRRVSWSTPTIMSAACSTAWRSSASLDDTLVYYIIGDNGASAEGTLNGTFNEMAELQRPGRPRDAGIPDGAARQARRPGVLQPLRRRLGARHEHALPVDQAGRLALGRHAQRHDRALAERHQGEGRDALAVPPRHRRRADDPRGGGAAGADLGERRAAAARSKGVSMLYSFNDAKAAERHETQYFEMFGNRGIYHKGWTAVTRHKTPWLLDRRGRPRPFDDDVWELYDTTKDWSQANDLSKQMPEKLHELQRLWLIEATRYNVLADRRRRRGADESRHRRSAGADQGKDPAALRRHGAPVGELRPQHQEQVALRHRRDRGARDRRRGRHHRPGRQHRRLEPVREGRQAQVLLQPGRRAALLRRGHRARCRQASTRSAWSSPMPAAASARAAR